MRATRWSFLAAVLFMAGGCGPTIRSTAAPRAELARYRTYAFYTPAYRRGQPETVLDQTIRAAVERELATKGLVPATTAPPDFLVAYHVKQQQKLDVQNVGYGFYGWPGAYVTEYTQGTLILDFIDPQTRQVFWRGTASGVVSHPESPDTRRVEKVVAKVVKRYPYQMAAVPRTAM